MVSFIHHSLSSRCHNTSSPDGAGGIFSCVLVSSLGFDVVVPRFLCGLYELLICYEIILLSTSIFHSTSTHLPVLFVVDLLIARAVIVLVHRPWAAVEVGLSSDALIGIHSMIGKLCLCIVVNKIPANWFLVLMLFRLWTHAKLMLVVTATPLLLLIVVKLTTDGSHLLVHILVLGHSWYLPILAIGLSQDALHPHPFSMLVTISHPSMRQETFLYLML